jgi:hypothetical protein
MTDSKRACRPFRLKLRPDPTSLNARMLASGPNLPTAARLSESSWFLRFPSCFLDETLEYKAMDLVGIDLSFRPPVGFGWETSIRRCPPFVSVNSSVPELVQFRIVRSHTPIV